MIRPASEIEYPPSDFARTKAAMLARMEALQASTNSLMAVIAKRLEAEREQAFEQVEELTVEQDRLIANMRQMAKQ